jgi:hypothetical protein
MYNSFTFIVKSVPVDEIQDKIDFVFNEVQGQLRETPGSLTVDLTTLTHQVPSALAPVIHLRRPCLLSANLLNGAVCGLSTLTSPYENLNHLLMAVYHIKNACA